MAEINDLGNVQANCPGCNGALASFEWRSDRTGEFGVVETEGPHHLWGAANVDYRLFRCAGCGRGGLGIVAFRSGAPYPGANRSLIKFTPDVRARLPLPKAVPLGIEKEFREAEQCLGINCIRAAAGMFRSVLDKTLRANGYKVKGASNLASQIDAAADDGVITQARKKRAHDDIRVLGNDVLHDEWQEIPRADVEAAHHYAQRILEDLYDDRPTVLAMLLKAGRVPEDGVTKGT